MQNYNVDKDIGVACIYFEKLAKIIVKSSQPKNLKTY